MEDAPLAALEVPAGQSCGVMVESAHQAPCGHRVGVPLAQKYEAGQGTQVSARMRLLAYSAVKRTPEGDMVREIGLINPADTPKPFAKDAMPLPEMVCTSAVDKEMERMRLPLSSAT